MKCSESNFSSEFPGNWMTLLIPFSSAQSTKHDSIHAVFNQDCIWWTFIPCMCSDKSVNVPHRSDSGNFDYTCHIAVHFWAMIDFHTAVYTQCPHIVQNMNSACSWLDIMRNPSSVLVADFTIMNSLKGRQIHWLNHNIGNHKELSHSKTT